MSSFKECLTRHKSMVATYLEDNYDKVKIPLPQNCLSLFCGFWCGRPNWRAVVTTILLLSPVFRHVYQLDPVVELRDQEAVDQTIGRNPVGPLKLQHHESVHLKRRQFEDHDEFVER
jgi:hypothetical protein